MTTRNPFSGMVEALTTKPPAPDKPAKPPPEHLKGLAVPTLVRAMVEERGPMTADEIGNEIGMSVVELAKIMRPSVWHGRVARVDLYAMRSFALVRQGRQGPADLDAQLQQAVGELQRLGYLVLAPGRRVEIIKRPR